MMVKLRNESFYVLMLLPALVLLVGIILWPFLNVFWLSMTSTHLLRPVSQFVGVQNFMKVLSNRNFWQAFWVDIVFTMGSVLIGAFIGLWASLLLHENLPFRSVGRALVLFPYVVPTVVAVLVWRYMFNDLYGILNFALNSVGLHSSTWLSSPRSALLATILVATWKFFPFFVIALLARLQVIPVELYEAAKVDGANMFQSFRYITLPSILPVFLLTIILRIIWTFNKFDIVFLLTGGGPGTSTTTLPILIYNKSFGDYRIGEAAAMAAVMFLFLGGMSMIYNYLNRRIGDINEQ